MKILLLIILTVFIAEKEIFCQNTIKPDSSILFEVSKGKDLLKDCSGSPLKQIVDTFWSPTQKDYQILEENFYKLDSLIRIRQFAIQYLGIILRGEKFIYLNGFHKSAFKFDFIADKDLTKIAYVTCGGGHYHWRVLFDMTRKEFINMKFNAPK